MAIGCSKPFRRQLFLRLFHTILLYTVLIFALQFLKCEVNFTSRRKTGKTIFNPPPLALKRVQEPYMVLRSQNFTHYWKSNYILSYDVINDIYIIYIFISCTVYTNHYHESSLVTEFGAVSLRKISKRVLFHDGEISTYISENCLSKNLNRKIKMRLRLSFVLINLDQ